MGWQRLYETATEGNAWRVSAPDASLVASLGVTLAFQECRFADAATLAQKYLEHPDAPESDPNAWQHLSVRRAVALVLDGRLGEGLAALQRVLEAPEREAIARHEIRNELLQALADLGESAKPDLRLVEFIAGLLRDWNGQEGKADSALEARTHQDLIGVLRSTYSSKSQ